MLEQTQLDLGPWVRPRDGVFWSPGCGEPTLLVDSVIRRSREVQLSAFCGMTLRGALAEDDARQLELWSYGALGRLRDVARRRPLRLVPCHYSALPALFAHRMVPSDVALLQLAPPDSNGRCSFGVEAGYVADAVKHARTIVAEINERMPQTAGSSIQFDDLDAVVYTDRPLLSAPPPKAGEFDGPIAESVADLVANGDTLQIGFGALPEQILSRLAHLKDLGIHSGVICDPIIDLVQGGVITGAAKPDHTGLLVTGAAVGSQRLFDFLSAEADVRVMPVSYTHSAAGLSNCGRLVAINSAIEIDLSGQVNAESVGDRVVGGIGGQVDFIRAAVSTGGTGVVALPSVVGSSGRSRIVPRLSGPITLARSDVDVVVTEHGVARLRGLDIDDRASALISLAAPEHREALARSLSAKPRGSDRARVMSR